MKSQPELCVVELFVLVASCAGCSSSAVLQDDADIFSPGVAEAAYCHDRYVTNAAQCVMYDGNRMSWSDADNCANKKDGYWECWHSWCRIKKSSGKCREGKEEGLWHYWDMKGFPSSKGHYSEGKRQGAWTICGAYGCIEEIVYYEGNIVRRIVRWPSGEIQKNSYFGRGGSEEIFTAWNQGGDIHSVSILVGKRRMELHVPMKTRVAHCKIRNIMMSGEQGGDEIGGGVGMCKESYDKKDGYRCACQRGEDGGVCVVEADSSWRRIGISVMDADGKELGKWKYEAGEEKVAPFPKF